MLSGRSISPAVFIAILASSAMANAQQCEAPNDWFPHAQTKGPVNTVASAENCDFHRWSWQTFLWLTQSVDGDPRFLSRMYSPEEVFDGGYQGKPSPEGKPLGGANLILRPRDNKPTSERGLKGVGQAGDNGILIDQNGHAVYYAIHLNDIYYKFIHSNHYNDPKQLKLVQPTDTFPVGTLMLKSSWRVVGPGEDTTGFYVRIFNIQLLKTEDGSVVIDPSNCVPRRMALVGLHVTGRVEGHPEFIWATFELGGNAPDLPPGVDPGSGTPVSPSDATFYKAGALARDCNRAHNKEVELVNPVTQVLTPITQVFRQFPWGGGTDAAQIQALNASVHVGLGTEVWRNYNLIGSLWSGKPDSLRPNLIVTDQTGSTRLANTTMETFRMGNDNCFSCHNTRGFSDTNAAFPAKNINLSHSLRQAFVLTSQFEALQRERKLPPIPSK